MALAVRGRGHRSQRDYGVDHRIRKGRGERDSGQLCGELLAAAAPCSFHRALFRFATQSSECCSDWYWLHKRYFHQDLIQARAIGSQTHRTLPRKADPVQTYKPLHDNPETRRRFGQAGREWAGRFTWDRIVLQQERACEQAIRKISKKRRRD